MAILTCENCGIQFEGRADARWHSPACRAAWKRRAKVNAVTTPKVNTPAAKVNTPVHPAVKVNPITELAFETGLTILGGGIKADESRLHEGHDVHPHSHPRPAPDAELFVAHCSGRWFCMTCRSEKSPTGTWFTGKVCVA
jgi:hypothetical protein